MRGRNTTKPQRAILIQNDENGNPINLRFPLAGIFYDTEIVSITQEMKIESKVLDLAGKVIGRDENNEQSLFDDDDRIDLFTRLKKNKKAWIK